MVTIMPDIAHQSNTQTQGALNWVGMSNIEMPITIESSDEPTKSVQAKIEAFVSLDDPQVKGIHMSRLYLLVDDLATNGVLNLSSLVNTLDQFIDSHQKISTNAFIKFDFDYPLRKASLLSGKAGWSNYPVRIIAEKVDGHLDISLMVKVTYSSTCPCSSALARQLIQDAFATKFSKQPLDIQAIYEWLGTTDGILATPHSQRSIAEVKVKLDRESSSLPIKTVIQQIEQALQTPVQAAVKREDEQEFARLNGQNTMFCEDAARRLQALLNSQTQYQDFWLRINHYESLHAHDAVSVATKGVPGGYRP